MSMVDEVFALAREMPLSAIEPTLPDGASDDAIHAFRARTGLVIPNALSEWLRFTNGPCFDSGRFFGVKPRHQRNDIESFYRKEMCPHWLEKGWIPITSDGCGDYYVLVTKPKDGPGNPVFFLDQDRVLEEPEYVAASDLWHFLRFCFRRALGEQGWPFDRDKVLEQDPALSRCASAPLPWDA